MTERERKMVEAARALINSVTLLQERECMRGLRLALAAYSEPPNAVFSQDVAWDSRKQVPVGTGEENLGGCK